MLVIRRRAGESLLIGDQIEIEILDVGPSQVKLGIRAPREVTVLRREVKLTGEENRAAATSLSGESLKTLLSAFSSISLPNRSHSNPSQR